MEQNDTFYEAMRTRDYRFDGEFFVGVKTTGIYCRQVCHDFASQFGVSARHLRRLGYAATLLWQEYYKGTRVGVPRRITQ